MWMVPVEMKVQICDRCGCTDKAFRGSLAALQRVRLKMMEQKRYTSFIMLRVLIFVVPAFMYGGHYIKISLKSF